MVAKIKIVVIIVLTVKKPAARKEQQVFAGTLLYIKATSLLTHLTLYIHNLVPQPLPYK